MSVMDRLAAANPVPSAAIGGLAAGLPGPPDVRRRAGRRRLGALVAIGAAVLVATPALAVRSHVWQTLDEFIRGDGPPSLRELFRVTAISGQAEPETIRLALTADGPDGEVQLYDLTYADGGIGLAVVGAVDGQRVGPSITWGIPQPTARTGLLLPGSGGGLEADRPVYFQGYVGPRVERVDVIYADGRTERAASGNGHVLGWIRPDPLRRGGDARIVARDAAGAELGRADICVIRHDVQIRDHTAGMPDDPVAACAIPPHGH